jgi:hypothetical protein
MWVFAKRNTRGCIMACEGAQAKTGVVQMDVSVVSSRWEILVNAAWLVKAHKQGQVNYVDGRILNIAWKEIDVMIHRGAWACLIMGITSKSLATIPAVQHNVVALVACHLWHVHQCMIWSSFMTLMRQSRWCGFNTWTLQAGPSPIGVVGTSLQVGSGGFVETGFFCVVGTHLRWKTHSDSPGHFFKFPHQGVLWHKESLNFLIRAFCDTRSH